MKYEKHLILKQKNDKCKIKKKFGKIGPEGAVQKIDRNPFLL